ncbi:hypothetical protein VE04_06246 [Pseudogymnoascus sp. 24MN13]|nr:hypothetical protein VE04_06246 [Pseudogymnoascus sp. 24MN13]
MSTMKDDFVSQSTHVELTTSLSQKRAGAEAFEARARDGNEIEHALSPLEAIKAYLMAIFWCLMVSMCVVMEGYDTILIANFFAYPTFAKKYGQRVDASGHWQLSASWQAAVGRGSGIGAFFGVLLNGIIVNKFGQKRAVIGALISLSCTLFIVFFAPDIKILLVGQILCGLPWGVFASSAPAYASEVLPLSLRVYMTSYTNMCFIMGQLIAAGVLAGLVNRTDEWGYRNPFALQWMWPVVLIPILCFAPESPWHLVRQNRLEEAEASLRRLQRASAPIDPQKTLAVIMHTNALEEELSKGTRYQDCYKGNELRRTEVACMAFMGQVLAGAPFAYTSTYFFQQVGMPTDMIYNMNVGATCMAFVGTLVSWFGIMPYFGRRKIYMGNVIAVGYTQSALCLVWTFTFQLSIGQLGWAIRAEVGSTCLRQKTICLARNAYYIADVVGGVLQPYFMNPTEWNLKGYTGFIWGPTCFILAVWAYFRLPETKGRTFDELDVLFGKRISARKFASYKVDSFHHSIMLVLPSGEKVAP